MRERGAIFQTSNYELTSGGTVFSQEASNSRVAGCLLPRELRKITEIRRKRQEILQDGVESDRELRLAYQYVMGI